MKLGILTQPLYNNYGGILQNYALQTELKRLGHEPTTINFILRPLTLSAIGLCMVISKNILRRLAGRKVPYLNPYASRKHIYTSTPEKKRFIDTYINKVDVIPPLTEEWASQQKYDGYVVGSDQVWRPLYSPCISNFFLDFTEGLKVKRMAYAASFGVSNWEFSPEITEKAILGLKRFDGISVRESAGVDMCNKYLNVKAIHVIDPTMLLTTDDYMELISKYDSLIQRKNDEYILCYTLDHSEQIRNIIKGIPEGYQVKVKFVSGENISSTDVSIEEWLNLIAKAKFVVTDSFHGTVFSILFHRPFATLINSNRGAERIKSLLSMFGLEKNMIKTATSNNKVNTFYDWQTVEERLSQYRKEAIEFINNSLS